MPTAGPGWELLDKEQMPGQKATTPENSPQGWGTWTRSRTGGSQNL